jgi:isochorismate pyruvate lyase
MIMKYNNENATLAIDQVQHCNTMTDVRRCVDALDDVLVPLLVQRSGYMTQAARIKQDYNQVRDEERIQAIVDRVRKQALAEGGEPAVIEAIYRSMMEVCISFEHREFARLRQGSAHALRAETSEGVTTP